MQSPPASVNPHLINCQGGQKESADVEIDKAQAGNGKKAEVPANKVKTRLNTITPHTHTPDKVDFGEGANGEGNQVSDSGDGDCYSSMLHHLEATQKQDE